MAIGWIICDKWYIKAKITIIKYSVYIIIIVILLLKIEQRWVYYYVIILWTILLINFPDEVKKYFLDLRCVFSMFQELLFSDLHGILF